MADCKIEKSEEKIEFKKICGVYKITSPSGRVYIGQSNDIERRYKRYKCYDCSNQPKLLRSLKKYTWENHIFEIIQECDREDLNCCERYWQDFYEVTKEKGLNCVLQECGDNPKTLSAETLLKMSESAKNRVRDLNCCLKMTQGNIGRKHTAETKQKMSEAKKGKYIGENNPNYGKKRTLETNEKILKNRRSMKGDQNPNYGKPMTQEQKDKISKTRIEKGIGKGADNYKAKKVLDKETNIIYGSIKEMSKELGMSCYRINKRMGETENFRFKIIRNE